jgi:hypothetical protein
LGGMYTRIVRRAHSTFRTWSGHPSYVRRLYTN